MSKTLFDLWNENGDADAAAKAAPRPAKARAKKRSDPPRPSQSRPIRLLHTSDWHLGIQLDSVSREEEHKRFFDWLLATLEREQVDVLIVAGDIFNTAQPSAEALRDYYEFLSRAAALGARRKQDLEVVVIGGNHDSAARLNAPRPLFDSLRVHVVGGMASAHRRDSVLVPIGPPEHPELVVVAVPFVHEYHLGVRTTSRTPSQIAYDLNESFEALYRDLADEAEARWPGVPLVTTGHLTCGRRDQEGAEIHQVGTIGALDPGLFDPRYRYVALGHLHQCFSPDENRVWYSGSPIAMNLTEAHTPRSVLLVELDGESTRVRGLPVPTWRPLIELRGSLEAVIEGLERLDWSTPFPPFVSPVVEVVDYEPRVDSLLLTACQTHAEAARPRIIRIRQERTRSPERAEADEAEQTPPLRELGVEDVFERLFRQKKGRSPDLDTLIAFRSLLGELEEEPACALREGRDEAA